MIFGRSIVVMSKPQLRALANCMNPKYSANVSGLFVDVTRARVAASDGYRVIVAGASPTACRGKSAADAFMVPADVVKATLSAAGATDAIGIWLDSNERVRVAIVPKGIAQHDFIPALKIDAFDCASKATTKLGGEPVRAKFPPFDNVLPAGEWNRKEGTATFGIGSRYLADVNTIGKSIHSQLVGGATARLLLPLVKSPLDPMLIALDDMNLGTYWLYCVMPVRI